MTSRTTKQAARAYQKAHGVPYAEALRRVLQVEETATEATDGRGSLGQVPGMFQGKPLDRSEPILFDPLTEEIITAQASGELVFNLGTGLLPETGFYRNTVPAQWAPAEAMQADRAATLGVYGESRAGKTVYLMTLVRDHLATVPTLVVSRESYPSGDGIAVLGDPEFVREARTAEGSASPHDQETLAAFQEKLDDALAEGIKVVVYDDGPHQPLSDLLRTARSRGLIVLFAGHDVELAIDGRAEPGRRLPEAAVTVMLDRQRERSVPSWVGVEKSWVRKAGRESMPLLRPEDPYLLPRG